MGAEESDRVKKLREIQKECQSAYTRIGFLDIQIASLESEKREKLQEAFTMNKKSGDIFANMTNEEKAEIQSNPEPKPEEKIAEVVNG